jgi:hypothetical protein
MAAAYFDGRSAGGDLGGFFFFSLGVVKISHNVIRTMQSISNTSG